MPKPPTEAGFHFNQLNIQQIPQTALDRLAPEQITGLLESTLRHSDNMDDRRYRYAMDHAEKQRKLRTLNTITGGAIAIAGLAVVAVLTYMGNDLVAGILATFLATIIAVVVGSKLFR